MSEYTLKKITTFRERFTELCDADPKNDSAIAAALHVSRQTVHYWKSGERSPKTPTVMAIADYFDVNVAWLMGFDVEKFLPPDDEPETEEETPKTPEARILAKGVDKMPQAQREAIMNLMIGLYPGIFEKENHHDDT